LKLSEQRAQEAAKGKQKEGELGGQKEGGQAVTVRMSIDRVIEGSCSFMATKVRNNYELTITNYEAIRRIAS
jgi:hypothetical protein